MDLIDRLSQRSMHSGVVVVVVVVVVVLLMGDGGGCGRRWRGLTRDGSAQGQPF